MDEMFRECESLKELNLSSFGTNKVTKYELYVLSMQIIKSIKSF